MKKFIIILSLFILKSQAQIIDIDTISCERGFEPNVYYKDVNNILNNFEGTWLYQNGSTILTIKFRKILNSSNTINSEDLLVGEYQFVENGVVKINTLNYFTNNYTDQTQHSIFGNCIIPNEIDKMYCSQCLQNQKRVKLMYSDPLKNISGTIIVGNSGVAPNETITLYIFSNPYSYIVDRGWSDINIQKNYSSSTIPNGWYTLTKQ